MTESDKLMKRLSAAQFAVWELHVFLDTHPNDKAALEAYEKYFARFKELYDEYNEKFENITAGINGDMTRWQWINSPWPWETEKESDK